MSQADSEMSGYAALTRPTMLPKGWELARIGEVASKCVQSKPADEVEFIYVDIGSIDRDLKRITEPQRLIGKDAPSRARKIINTGDVLVSLTRPNLNAVVLVSGEFDNQIASTGFEVIKPVKVDSGYIFAIVRSKAFIDSISGKVQGALYPAAKSEDVREYQFPLPPLTEQQQIADQLDELLAQVNIIKTRLDTIPKILKRFRQSVLAAAVSGKLTEEWREINDCSSLALLLNNIEIERNSLKAQKKLKKNFGNTEQVEPLYENIAATWHWVCFDQISENNNNALKAGPFGSALKKIDCTETGYKVYGQEQVIAGDESLVTYFINQSKFDDLKSCKVKAGDILISLVGTIGKILVLSDKSEPGIINPRLVKLSLNDQISKDFIRYYLNSPIAMDFFKGFSHGGTMEILNLGVLRQLPIALPPTEEQTEIVNRVEQLFVYADQIEQRVKDAQAKVNNLTQAILAKAFRGELTADWRAQNPDLISGENSAVALLAKIKAECETLATTKKTGKK
jgi:type I restriction enzyme S subunit